MKAHFSTECMMDMERKYGLMVIGMMANGKIINSMEKAFFIINQRKLNQLIFGKKEKNGILSMWIA